MARDIILLHRESADNIFTINDADVKFRYNNVVPVKTEDLVSFCPRPGYTDTVAQLASATFVTNDIFTVGANITTSTPTFVARTDTTLWDSDLTSHSIGTDFDEKRRASFLVHYQADGNYVLNLNAGNATSGAGKEGNFAYTTQVGSSFSLVSDVNAPGNNGNHMTRGGASISGYLFIGDIDGNIQNSNLDDFQTWTALDVQVAERISDVGVYTGKQKDHVVYIGTNSIEFFYLDPTIVNGSPLQRRQDIFYNIGSFFPNSVIELGDTIYFIGIDPNTGPELYKLENFQLSIITPPELKEDLSSFTNIDILRSSSPDACDLNVFLSVVPTHEGERQLYYMRRDSVAGTVAKAFTIDTKYKIISRWFSASTPAVTKGGVSNWTDYTPIVGGDGPYVCYANGDRSQLNTSGRGAATTMPKDIDAIAAATAYIYTDAWHLNTDDRKKIPSIRVLNHKRLDSSIDTDDASLQWLDLDTVLSGGITDANFTTARTVNTNKTAARIFRCGMTRSRIFKLNLDNYGLFYGLELHYELLRN